MTKALSHIYFWEKTQPESTMCVNSDLFLGGSTCLAPGF